MPSILNPHPAVLGGTPSRPRLDGHLLAPPWHWGEHLHQASRVCSLGAEALRVGRRSRGWHVKLGCSLLGTFPLRLLLAGVPQHHVTSAHPEKLTSSGAERRGSGMYPPQLTPCQGVTLARSLGGLSRRAPAVPWGTPGWRRLRASEFEDVPGLTRSTPKFKALVNGALKGYLPACMHSRSERSSACVHPIVIDRAVGCMSAIAKR